MSKQVLRESLPKLKDKKIQIYYPEIASEDSEELLYKKRYIYTEYKKRSGGLWAYYRQSSLKETMDGERATETVDAQFTVNHNTRISSDMFIEFYNPMKGIVETYGIVGEPDGYEGYKGDIRLNTRLVSDNREYISEVYDEQ